MQSLFLLLGHADISQLPPELPPRNFASNDVKDADAKTAEQLSKSLPDTMLTRLQQLDTATYGHPELKHFRI